MKYFIYFSLFKNFNTLTVSLFLKYIFPEFNSFMTQHKQIMFFQFQVYCVGNEPKKKWDICFF